MTDAPLLPTSSLPGLQQAEPRLGRQPTGPGELKGSGTVLGFPGDLPIVFGKVKSTGTTETTGTGGKTTRSNVDEETEL